MEILEILDRCANLEYPEGNSAGHRRALERKKMGIIFLISFYYIPFRLLVRY